VVGKKRPDWLDERSRAVTAHVERMTAAVSKIRPDEYRVVPEGKGSHICDKTGPTRCAEQIKLHVRCVKSRYVQTVCLQECADRSERVRAGEVADNWNEPIFGFKLLQLLK